MAVSREQMNGFRLQLAREKMRELLENKFLEIFPMAADPEELYKAMKCHEKLLKDLKKHRILKIKEFNILLPNTCKTYIADIDESLFMLLLRQNKIGGLMEPKRGWFQTPHPHDRSDEANLIRFQIARNEIQHCSVSVSDAQYKRIFGMLKCALLDYGCQKDDMDFILTSCLDETTMIRLQQKTNELNREKTRADQLENCLDGVQYKLLPTHSKFIGRIVEIEKLHHALDNLPDGNIGVNVTGMPGVGKTELTRYYCNYYEQEYDNNVLWINGENRGTISESFQSITDIIKLDSKDNDERKISDEAMAHRLYNYFGNRKVLLVFDNVKQFSDIESFLPPSKSVKPTIILTSQAKDFAGLFQQIELKTFSPRDAATYIEKHSSKSIKNTDKDIENLLNLLGYHPLAIAHAVSYANSNSITYKEYTELYHTESDELLLERIYNNFEHKNVLTTFNLAIKRLRDVLSVRDGTLKLLSYVAHVDGKEIKKGFLLQLFNGKKRNLNKALENLVNYSLVERPDTLDWQEYFDQIVTVHSLVQLASQIDQRKQKCYKSNIKELLSVIFKDSDKEISKETGKYWTNHIVYMANQKGTERITLSTIGDEKIEYIKEILFMYSRYNDAKDIFMKLLPVTRNFIVLTYIAECIGRSGNILDAKQSYERLLKVQLKFSHPSDPNILAAKLNLANCLRDIGDLEEASEMLRSVLNTQLKVLPPNDAQILRTKHNLATCLVEQGDIQGALGMFQSVLNTQLQIFPSSHFDVLSTKFNVANCLVKTGNFTESMKMFINILKEQLKILPPNNMDILYTKNSIAICLFKNGNLQQALKMFKDVLKIKSEVLPLNHKTVLSTKQNLASCLMENGDLKEALEIYQSILEKQLETLPPNNLNVMCTKQNLTICLTKSVSLADSLVAKGDLAEAVQLYQGIKNTKMVSPVTYNKIIMKATERLAFCLESMSRYEEAIEIYENLLKGKMENTGHDNDINCASTMTRLALCLHRNGDGIRSMQVLNNAAEIMNCGYDIDHPVAVNILTAKREVITEMALPFIRAVLSQSREKKQ